jgi:hypothetical protein
VSDTRGLSGDVEADETFIGGRLREGERRALRAQGILNAGPASKKRDIVVGAVERRGKLRATVVKLYGVRHRSRARAAVKVEGSQEPNQRRERRCARPRWRGRSKEGEPKVPPLGQT